MKIIKNLFPFISIVLLAMLGCNNAQPKDSEKVADKANAAKTETQQSEEDAKILVNAVSSDYFQIAASEQAVLMASNPQVKEFAGRMIQMHKTSLGETISLAARKGYTVPSMMSNDYTDDIEDLKKRKKGKDFDTQYMKGQTDQHQSLLDQLEKGMADTKDSDIKMWTETMVGGIRSHLQLATSINTQVEESNK